LTNKTGTKQTEDLKELRVEEFLDRAACIIAREKTKNTNLEYLFKKEPKNYSSAEGRKELAENIRGARKDSRNLKEYFGRDDKFIDNQARKQILHFRTHTAYSYADQYSADELLKVKNLYSLPDQEIREKFMKKRHHGLEGRILGIFVVLASFLFLFPKITGNVIGGTLLFSEFIGVVLFILGLFFLLKK